MHLILLIDGSFAVIHLVDQIIRMAAFVSFSMDDCHARIRNHFFSLPHDSFWLLKNGFWRLGNAGRVMQEGWNLLSGVHKLCHTLWRAWKFSLPCNSFWLHKNCFWRLWNSAWVVFGAAYEFYHGWLIFVKSFYKNLCK